MKMNLFGWLELPTNYDKSEFSRKENAAIEKIVSESILRNSTLKNLSKEAFERFKSMNDKTVN